MFREHVLLNPALARHFDGVAFPPGAAASNLVEVEATMWAATHRFVLDALTRLSIPLIFYEDLFHDPFRLARLVLARLGFTGTKLHPAHIFTPSMVTMKTTHDLATGHERTRKNLAFFYENKLSDEDKGVISRVLSEFKMDIYGSDSMPIKARLDPRISLIE